jgi:hypothetical protein
VGAQKENLFVLHIRLKYISFVYSRYSIFNQGYAPQENIASGVHSVKYISLLHAKQTNILYIMKVSLPTDTET